MRFHTTEKLGPKQSLTPEGFLLCEAVPIARTGTQLYAEHEMPKHIEAGRNGLVRVVRDEAEVFRPETIASFEGKSVVIGHTFVDSENVKSHEVGHMQNVRRSTDEPDLLLADLLIKDEAAIRAIHAGYAGKEMSCGYVADYVQDEPGIAYQRNILGNHAAIIKKGRAGSRCSIQDEDLEMKTLTPLQRLIQAFRSKDEALIARTVDAAEAEAEAEAQRVADEAIKTKDEEIAALKRTVDELNAKVTAASKPAETVTKTADEIAAEAKHVADAMVHTASRAEILVPGFVMPTADSVGDMSAVVVVQRKVLNDAMKTADGKEVITPLLSGQTVDALPDVAVRTVFTAAAVRMGDKNNARGAVRGVQTKDFGKAPVTVAEINRRNAEFWAKN